MTHQTNDQGYEDLDNLLSRIGKCLTDDALTSSKIGDLQDQATQLMDTIKAHADQSRRQLLEPLLPRAQIVEAKQKAEAADVDYQRLGVAIELLGVRCSELIDMEAAERKLKRYLAACANRDLTANLISENFPKIQADLLAMIEAIMESNLEVDNVNSDLPEGKATLERSEGIARGFTDIGSYQTLRSIQTFRITQLVLPCAKDPSAVAWPERLFYDRDVQQAGRGFPQSPLAWRWKKSRA